LVGLERTRLRINIDQVNAALPGRSALLADLHAHTVASGHAFNTLDELARAAAERGIQVLGVTDHGPSMQGAPTPGYFEMVERVPSIIHGLHILLGCESAIVNATGGIDLHEPWCSRQRLVLAGLHERTPYPPGATTRENTAAMIGAIALSCVHVISHPYRAIFPVEVELVADAAANHGTLLEVNLSVFRGILRHAERPDQDETVVATRRMLG
jgi:putative hydrolase